MERHARPLHCPSDQEFLAQHVYDRQSSAASQRGMLVQLDTDRVVYPHADVSKEHIAHDLKTPRLLLLIRVAYHECRLRRPESVAAHANGPPPKKPKLATVLIGGYLMWLPQDAQSTFEIGDTDIQSPRNQCDLGDVAALLPHVQGDFVRMPAS